VITPVPSPIIIEEDKYYVVRIANSSNLEFDIDMTFATPNGRKTRLFAMTVDPFSDYEARELYAMFIEPFVEKLPEGKKDLDYFVLYHDGTEWKAYDVEQYVAPRTWLGLREVTGLKDL
jgi:hypothetical protein